MSFKPQKSAIFGVPETYVSVHIVTDIDCVNLNVSYYRTSKRKKYLKKKRRICLAGKTLVCHSWNAFRVLEALSWVTGRAPSLLTHVSKRGTRKAG